MPEKPPRERHEKTRPYGEMGRSAHLLARPAAYGESVRRKTGTTMDANILRRNKGGDWTLKIRFMNIFAGGVISPCSSRGPWPNPAATRGVSLQAKATQRNGRKARRAERENDPAAPHGGSVRD